MADLVTAEQRNGNIEIKEDGEKWKLKMRKKYKREGRKGKVKENFRETLGGLWP